MLMGEEDDGLGTTATGWLCRTDGGAGVMRAGVGDAGATTDASAYLRM